MQGDTLHDTEHIALQNNLHDAIWLDGEEFPALVWKQASTLFL